MKTTISTMLLSLALLAGCDPADGSTDPLAARGVELLDEEHFEAFSTYIVEIDGAERQILDYNGPLSTRLVLDPEGKAILAVEGEDGVVYSDPSQPEGTSLDEQQLDEASATALEVCEQGLLPHPFEFRKPAGCYTGAAACWNTCAGAGIYGADTSACWAGCAAGFNGCS